MRERTKPRPAQRVPVCKFCGRSGAGVQFAIFSPRFPPFGTACTDCEASISDQEAAAKLAASDSTESS